MRSPIECLAVIMSKENIHFASDYKFCVNQYLFKHT
jgi:hypothetical protein